MSFEHILVVADIAGKWELFYDRLIKILTLEDQVQACFCIGTCFDEETHGLTAFIEKRKKFPIPLYLVCGEEGNTDLIDHIPIQGGEIAANIYYLGRFGIQEVAGLRVCYLSGIFDAECFASDPVTEYYSDFYTANDLKSIQVNFNSVDLLLTTEWPKGVQKNIPNPNLPDSLKGKWDNVGNDVVKSLCSKCSPRAHFATKQNVYWVPQPHRNYTDSQCTYFVALASFDNKKQQRYCYAAKICPLKGLSSTEIRRQAPLDVRPCPFRVPPGKRRKTSHQLTPPVGYMCGLCGSERHWFRACPRYKEPSEFQRLHEQVYGMGTSRKGCGYCFTSQGVSKHLIISVGLHCYLTLSRTPVVPNHFFIVPNEHVRSSAEFNENQKKEVTQYIRALSKCFAPQVLLVFERNLKLQKHGFLEIVPVVRGQLPQLPIVLRRYERNMDMLFNKIDPDEDLTDTIGMYGFLSIGDSEGQRYLHVIDPTRPRVRNDVLRKMVCKIMGFPDSYNYTKQKTSKEDQTKIVAMVKERFGPFDPFTEKRYNIPTTKNKLKIQKQVIEIDEDSDLKPTI